MKLILKDSNVYRLPHQSGRFVHVATISKGLREFMCFKDTITKKMYVEETTTGRFLRIKEDELWQELNDFLKEKKLLTIQSGDDPESPQVKIFQP